MLTIPETITASSSRETILPYCRSFSIKRSFTSILEALRRIIKHSSEESKIYREEILDHYKRPRNTGTLNTKLSAEGENPSCGDDTTVYIEIEDGKISEIRHETEGCAISTAGISIISEELEGEKAGKVQNLGEEWMLETLGIDISPMRKKCAMLGLRAIQKALKQK